MQTWFQGWSRALSGESSRRRVVRAEWAWVNDLERGAEGDVDDEGAASAGLGSEDEERGGELGGKDEGRRWS